VRRCVLNHSTGRDDVDRVLDWLVAAPVAEDEVPSTVVVARLETRTADLTAGWPGVVAADADELAGLPLFADVEPRVLDWVGSVATRRRVDAGETVVRQWEVDRDFYLIVNGEADVLGQEQQLGTMGAGDFFGELAALDWGASFGYPRLATVKARTDLVLLVLNDVELAELMSRVPAVDMRIRAAAAARATRL